jgi:glucose-6-phosphate dehydrogenase assembly protein OpcA
MNENIKSAGDCGSPVEANPESIEKGLTSLWESASRESFVMRASVCNLIAVVRNQAAAESFLSLMTSLSETHPSRCIVAYPDSGDPLIQAWIRALCSTPVSGGRQVCCESITLAIRGKAINDLPNVLLPLYISDLPVYLYWRSFRIVDREIIERIARFSNLLIVDSHQSKQDPQNRLRLLQLLIDLSGQIAVRDLNWARITAWRDLIAQFFDSKAFMKFAYEISEVEIVRNLSAPESMPTRTLLLTGWLASSLSWRLIDAKRSQEQWLSTWTSEKTEIRVRFSGSLAAPNQSPGINSILLKTRNGAEFSVSVDEGSSCITASARLDGAPLVHSVPQESLDEASLLAFELSQKGNDVVFQAALDKAMELEKSFLMGE